MIISNWVLLFGKKNDFIKLIFKRFPIFRKKGRKGGMEGGKEGKQIIKVLKGRN